MLCANKENFLVENKQKKRTLLLELQKNLPRLDVQGVLDYLDLDYRDLYSWDSSTSIIGISRIGELFLDLVISIIEDLYSKSSIIGMTGSKKSSR